MQVSVVITCYNRERFISRAIRSAISQRFPRENYEVIVVDDGSTDNSPKIIKDFGDEVIPIFFRKNRGLPAARNTGIQKARGRFVVHLDSDDYFHDELLHVEYLHLAMNPDWGAVACDYFDVDVNESHIVRHDAQKEPIACGIMFRKENLIEIGLYDERMRLCEDEELRRRYQERYTTGYVHLPLYRYTKHADNMTNDIVAVTHYRKKLNGTTGSDSSSGRCAGSDNEQA
ncbi:MAG: glycosyltransferase family A protein [Chloroflexota bacterium]